MKPLLFSLVTLLFLISCSKKDSDISNALPSLTTNTVSAITSTEAVSGGNISSAGSATVTARGVVWSINANPTIDLITKTSDGSGAGTFTSSITGLLANTTYHVRAYATSSTGTAYGNDISFTTSSPKLYACGTLWSANDVFQRATIWIDGNESFLGDAIESIGQGMYVTDAGDVYVAGTVKSSTWRALYWKNGAVNYLTYTDGTTYAAANAVFVDGTDVYVTGYETNSAGKRVAKYWKNGTAVSLTDGTKDAEGKSIQVSNNIVRVAGYERKDISGTINEAKYWNGGTVTTILTGGVANSILVSGTDVHIAGTFNASSERGWYWKNGTMTDLTAGYGANKVLLSGTDVYVAGFNNAYEAAYWKNGAITNLNGGFSANSISLYNNDVYAGGVTSANNPCYWKNGTRTNLSSSTNYHNNVTDIIYK